MKKIKYLLFFLLLIPFIVNADDIEVISVDDYMYGPKGILYSNGKLLISEMKNNVAHNTYYDNVKKFNIVYYYNFMYLTNDNKIIYYNNEVASNVKDYIDIEGDDYEFNDLYYIDNDNNLYGKCLETYSCTSLVTTTNTLIQENVKKAIIYAHSNESITLLYLTYNNELYFMGTNYFGNKINSGNNTTTPIKLLDNIVDFEYMYAINNNNDLYIFSSSDPRPTIYYNNVKGAIVDTSIAVETNNNKNYIIYYSNNEFKSIEVESSVKKIINNYILLNNDKLYYRRNDKLYYIDDNVVDINMYYSSDSMFIYLKNNGEVYCYNGENIYWSERFYIPSPIQKLYIGEYTNRPILYLKNVKSIKFANKNYIILNNNEIFRFGNGKNGVFYGIPYIESLLPIQINELINDDKEIKVNQIYLSVIDIYDYTVGDEFDAYATALPYNATNRDLVWVSSNPEVATVNNEGYVITKKVGSTTLTVKTSDESISESVTINVHPKVSSIEITNGEEVQIGTDERLLLTAKVYPEDTIKKKMTWEILDKNDNDEVYLNNYYWDDNEIVLNDNQRMFRAYNGGTYRVKITSEDKTYSDIITINVIEKVSYIKLDIPKENYDGYNAFIFLFETNHFQAVATPKEDSATNKELRWSSNNTSIAEVSQTGLITGKKAGRAIITVESVDGGASRSFNVIVYDQNGNGDANNTEKISSSPKISVTKYGDNSALISFDKVMNATSYEIYRSTSKTKNYKKIATIENNSYINTNITYGTTYYYKVIAKNSKYKSSYSNIVSIKVLPETVKNLKVDNITSTSIKVSYDKVNATGYEVYYGTSTKSMKKATTISKADTLSYNKTSLKANTTYYFKVRAYKKIGSKKVYGCYSSILTVKTAPAVPSVTVSNKDYQSLSITIKSVSGASKYVVEKSLDKVNFNVLEELPVSGVLVDSELTLDQTYYYRVKSCNASDVCSNWTSVLSKKVIPTTSTVTLKSSTTKKVNIILSSVLGVDGYEIYRSNYSNKNFKLITTITDLDNLTYEDATSKGKTYYYKVRTYKLLGDTKIYSSYSSVKKVKSK